MEAGKNIKIVMLNCPQRSSPVAYCDTTVNWSTSNNHAYISTTGLVTGNNCGIDTITATSKDGVQTAYSNCTHF